MRKEEARYIVLNYLCGWCGLIANHKEDDFYNEISPYYLLETKPNNCDEIIKGNKYISHCATDEERDIISKEAGKIYDKLIKDIRKIELNKTKTNQ